MLAPVLLLLVAVQSPQTPFDSLHFRSIGPAVMGGRVHDVEAVPNDPAIVYVATATGGIWKSVNKGTTWTPIFDDQPVSTFGDVALAPSNPDVVWAGTGEQNNRQSTSWGNGVYRSTDGGKTWTHHGLAATRHIGRIRVHPRNPDVAYVAALGHLWAPTPDRGVYKTTDGGRTWSKVLYVDTLTGVVDLAMDPTNPDVLYAAAYQRLRRAWGFNGGGPKSGIYK
ncbi:MAG: WD40/YVTN/BNR-like repeat-containing protein, partial [Gemmatimonadales bacterium]